MALKRVNVSIQHTFEVDIPDELLEDVEDGSDALDDFIYGAFEDSDWYFSDMYISEA